MEIPLYSAGGWLLCVLYALHFLRLCMFGHTYSKSMDQPGKVVNPARGQLNRKMNIFLSAVAPENLVSGDGFVSPVPRQLTHLHTQAEYDAYLCVFVCFHPIHSGHQVRWTYQPGLHRRKVRQDFSSTFFLRCVP